MEIESFKTDGKVFKIKEHKTDNSAYIRLVKGGHTTADFLGMRKSESIARGEREYLFLQVEIEDRTYQLRLDEKEMSLLYNEMKKSKILFDIK